MSDVLLLTATVQPADVIFCERRDVSMRLDDYRHAFRFWLGEAAVRRIVLVENSGFDLEPFAALANRYGGGKEVELIGFKEPPFDPGLGKSWGEARIIRHAFDHSRLLRAGDAFVLKGTGRYCPTNFFRIWPRVMAGGLPFALANFYPGHASADSRFFGGHAEFFRDYFLPACATVNDAAGRYIEHALADALSACIAQGRDWRPFPGGGLLVDGVQASRNLAFRYPRWRRLAYRAAATWRNGVPFRWKLSAPEE
jgi:hypothetical protein